MREEPCRPSLGHVVARSRNRDTPGTDGLEEKRGIGQCRVEVSAVEAAAGSGDPATTLENTEVSLPA